MRDSGCGRWLSSLVALSIVVVGGTPSWADWQRLGLAGVSLYRVAAYPGDPDVLFAGGGPEGGDGMYRSTDGGVTWTLVSDGLPIVHRVNTIAFDAAAPAPHPILIGILKLGEGPFVYRSTDLGDTWHGAGEGLPGGRYEVREVAFDPLVPGVGYASLNAFTAGGVHKTTDGGETWTDSSTGLFGDFCVDTGCGFGIAIDPSTPSTLYVAIPDGPDVFKSTDAGASWAPTGAGLWAEVVVVSPAATDVLFTTGSVPGEGGLKRSTDGGDTWMDLATLPTLPQPPDNTSYRVMARDPGDADVAWVVIEDNIFTGGQLEAVWRTVDGGDAWALADAGLEGVRVHGLAFWGDTLLAATDDGVYRYAEDEPPPTSPMELIASALGPTDVYLAWNDNLPDETEFRIETRRGDGSFEDAGTVPADTESTVLEDLQPDTTYTFRVHGVGPAGILGTSSLATVHTPSASTGCSPDAHTLCLQDDRFRVQAHWWTPTDRGGAIGRATGNELTSETGTFWFFDAANVELVLKVLDGCHLPGHRYWVFLTGLTNLKVDVVVTDTSRNVSRVYMNPQGMAFPPLLDTDAFATCP